MGSVCRACGIDGSGVLFCEECGTLRSLADVQRRGKFEVFGLTPVADLSKKTLEAAYLKVSRRLHPDKFRGMETEASAARRLSAFVNEAYATLRDPVKRSRYLIERSGEDPASKATPAFLAEQLEYRERLEVAPREELQGLIQQIKAEYDRSLNGVLESLQAAETDRSAYRLAAKEYVKLTYWMNLLRQAQEQAAANRGGNE